jgi:DNA-binding NarL/FixJ family response regulator
MALSAAPPPAPTDAADAAMRVLIVGANAFSRACTVASLGTADDLALSEAADIEDDDAGGEGAAPDLLLFQHGGEPAELLAARLRRARQAWPDALLAVMSDDAPGIADAAVQAGAILVLSGDAGPEALIVALRMARAGLAIVPRAVLRRLRQSARDAAGALPDTADVRRAVTAALTPRQQEVVAILAKGLSNKAIASQLGISESTVKVHVRAIMSAVGVRNRTQFVARFFAG